VNTAVIVNLIKIDESTSPGEIHLDHGSVRKLTRPATQFRDRFRDDASTLADQPLTENLDREILGRVERLIVGIAEPPVPGSADRLNFSILIMIRPARLGEHDTTSLGRSPKTDNPGATTHVTGTVNGSGSVLKQTPRWSC